MEEVEKAIIEDFPGYSFYKNGTAESIKEANEFLGLSENAGVRNCLIGKNKTVKGYTVIKDSNANTNISRERGSRNENGGKAIYQLDNDMNILNEFPTIISAIKEILPDVPKNKCDRKSSHITTAIIRETKAYGFYWKYKNPPENLAELKQKLIEKSRKFDAKYREIRRNLKNNIIKD